MIVYSCADRASFRSASMTLKRLKEELDSTKTVMIVANKVDLARKRHVTSEGMCFQELTFHETINITLLRYKHWDTVNLNSNRVSIQQLYVVILCDTCLWTDSRIAYLRQVKWTRFRNMFRPCSFLVRLFFKERYRTYVKLEFNERSTNKHWINRT